MMDDFDSLSWASCLKKLKCTNCNNHLSCFPIFICENKHNICGRCHLLVPAETVLAKNEAYENIAQCVRFPCRYAEEGCIEKLLPVDTPQHEKLCPFRTITCPTSEFTQCSWQGALPNTHNHCQDKHFDIILKNGEFEFDLSQSHSCDNLIEYNSLMFIVTRKYFSINKCLAFSICNVECDSNKKSFLCEIIFKNVSRNVIIQCSTTPFGEKKITEIFLDSLRDPGNESFTISAKISLEKVHDDLESSNKETIINEEMLSLLKCMTCLTYALPPIYQSTDNTLENSVKCSDCRAKYQVFGTTTVRNINLDKIAGLLNYPCKNHQAGCDFISKPDKMIIHQQFCSFGTHCCPLSSYIGCKWTGLGKEIGSHLRETHEDMLVKNDSQFSEALANPSAFENTSKIVFTKTASNSAPKFIKCYIISFSDSLFLLNFAEINSSIYWTVQFLGQTLEKFMYELEIIDNTNSNQALITRQQCTSLRKKDEVFSFYNSHRYFQKQQLQSFIYNQAITFKVKIFK